MNIDWNRELLDQLDWHWRNQLRPRLDGLSDLEYLWEPVAGCWSVRRRGESRTAQAFGTGEHLLDFAYPEPDPAPVTTIAWRLGHVIASVLGTRTASHFGGPQVGYDSFAYAGTAKEALQQLDEAYGRWVDGVRGLGEEGLARPCGPAEGPFAEYPLAALVLHINREMLHHGAEIALLRDLYRAGPGRGPAPGSDRLDAGSGPGPESD
ncbi:DinB family protein [Micromonospora sp. NPDC004704]